MKGKLYFIRRECLGLRDDFFRLAEGVEAGLRRIIGVGGVQAGGGFGPTIRSLRE